MGALIKFPTGEVESDDRDPEPEPQSPKSTDPLPPVDHPDVKRLPEYFELFIGMVDQMDKWKCVDIMEHAYELLGKEMPLVGNNTEKEPVILNNELELKDCKTVREELKDILRRQFEPK